MHSETPHDSATSSPTREDGPARKRRRTRTGIACDSCQRRKTRCELLDGDGAGCHRCQVLGTFCSLLPDESSAPDVVDTRIDADRLRSIDDRTDRIEKALAKILTRGSGPSEGMVERPNDPPDVLFRHHGTGPMVLRAFRQSIAARWIDPVQLGLVSEKQMEQSVHQYLDQTALIYPVDSIKDLIKQHSSHPLVRTAIILYTMPHLRPRLHKMLQANLGVADAVQSSTSIFIGYLILSQICQTKEELVTAIDVHSAAIRGMGQAMAVGLDDIVHVVAQPGFDWSIETESVERLAALYLMAHRLAWTHAFSSRGFTHQMTLPLLINILPIATAMQLRSRLLLHLTLESMLLVLLEPVIQAFRRVRLERPFDEQSIHQLIDEFTGLRTKLIHWRADVDFHSLSSSPFLLFHSHLVEDAVAMVLSGAYIPTPILYPGRMELITTFGGPLLDASLNGIQHVLESNLDLSLVPSFHLILALLPLAALVQSGKLHPDNEAVVSRHVTLVQYRQVLSQAHPKMKLLIEDLDRMCHPHDYTLYAHPDTEHTGGAYDEWDVGLDQLFDFETLWPMMNDWLPHDALTK